MKLAITEERMLLLMNWALSNDIAENETDYLEQISFPRTNFANIKAGRQRFTRDHIHNACKLTGCSADYIFGFQNTMLRKQSRKAIDLLKEAVMAVDLEIKQKDKNTRYRTQNTLQN